MKASVLILDASNLAYRSYYSMAKLNNRGKPVSVIYGLPILVASYIKQFQPKRVYLVWDGKKSKHRLKLLPGYKDRGDKVNLRFDPEDFYKQKATVMDLFNSLGVAQPYHLKYEADDLIYRLYKKFPNHKKVICSNDKDFHQLLDDTTFIMDAKNNLLTKKNLKSFTGYTPEQCVDFLCLTGDDSDKIPGYPKIGPSRAQDFLLEHSSIDSFLSSNKKHKFIEKEQLAKLYELNRQLIDLAFYHKTYGDNKKIPHFLNDYTPEVNKGRLFKICDEYFINTFRKKSFLNTFQK
jgi:5'-3' exonuclease